MAEAAGGGAAQSATDALGAILGKLVDPSTVLALSAQSGLNVTPVVFQSVEAEGRWKPEGLLPQKEQGREFELRRQLERKNAPPPVPVSKGQATNGIKSAYWGSLYQFNQNLFSVNVPGNLGNSAFTVDATWWGDGLEIWAGYAGLSSAVGFGSVYNDTAAATMYAIPFGNYYPALTLITWTGWVNPYLKTYWEFRGGMVLCADGPKPASAPPAPLATGPAGAPISSLPAYMTVWSRDGTRKDLPAGSSGFVFDAGDGGTQPAPPAARKDFQRG